jgi:hypothetical protein
VAGLIATETFMTTLFMRAFTAAAMLGVGSLAILSLFGVRLEF